MKGKILKILISCFFSAVQGRRIRIGTGWLAGVGNGKGKIIKVLISCFLFSSPGPPDLDFHRLTSRGYASGKVRYLRYLFLAFFSAVQGRRIRIGTSWQARGGQGER